MIRHADAGHRLANRPAPGAGAVGDDGEILQVADGPLWRISLTIWRVLPVVLLAVVVVWLALLLAGSRAGLEAAEAGSLVVYTADGCGAVREAGQ